MKQTTHKPLAALPRLQRGVGTLLISLVILTTITFILIYSARTVLTETQLTRNDMNGRQAFEAAEAGQEAAAAYLSTPRGRDKDLDGLIVTYIDPVNPTDNTKSELDEFLFDTDATVGNDSNTLTLDNGAQVTVTIANVAPPPGAPPIIGSEVTTRGWSADRTAFREIHQLYAFVTPLPNFPTNPLLTRGQIVVNGAAEVINPEGHSTIWSGGPVDLSGNANTKSFIADPSKTDPDPGASPPTGGYPDCLGARSLDGSGQCATVESSSRDIAGLDIIEQDSSLRNLSREEFFLNFFGMSAKDYKHDAVTIMATPAESELDSPVGANLAIDEVVWVDGKGPKTLDDGTNNASAVETSWNGLSAGCTEKGTYSVAAGQVCGGDIVPTIIVVDGDLTVAGNITIWGLLYVTGNVKGAGSVKVIGAMMMQGDNSDMSGNITVRYNSEVLRSTADNGPLGGAGGTWRDF